MAERLPRYRPLGVSIASVPSVDFTQAAQIEARGTQQLAAALDKMSQFAFAKAGEFAAEEGIRYGAENAPTMEQIELAKSEGRDVLDLVPGDRFTTYGQAARKAALQMISDNTEIEARNIIAQLKIEASNSDLSMPEFRDQLDAVIDGYGENLKEIDPLIANKFKASVAAVANSALVSHAGKLQAKAKDRQEVAALAGMDQIVQSSIQDAIDAGSVINEQTGEFTSIQMRIQHERNNIIKFGMAVGDKTLVNQKLKEFDNKVNELLVGEVVDYVSQNPVRRFYEMRAGTFDDPHVQDIYGNMDDGQRRDAFEAANDAITDMLSRDAALDRADERRKSNRSDEILVEFTDAIGNPDLQEKIIEPLKTLNPPLYNELKSDIYTKGAEDSSDAIVRLDNLQYNGELRFKDVSEALKNGELSISTYRNYLNKLTQTRDERFREAMKVVKNILGYPDKSIVVPGAEQRKRDKIIGGIENQLLDRKRTEPDFDVISEAKRLANEQLGLENKDSADYKSAIEDLRKALNAPSDATAAKLRDLMNERVADDSEFAQQHNIKLFNEALKSMGVR